jgi:hypothetical protein
VGGAAAAIGTKAAAGLATAAIIAGGAAEIQQVSDHHPPAKPQSKSRNIDRHKATPAADPKAQPTPAAATPATAPPTAEATPTTTPPPPAGTVTVPPQPTDPAATATAQTGGTTAAVTGKRKHHKNAVANSDSQPQAPAQTGPVTTGVEPATCDADGDGVTDPSAPSSCSTTPTDGVVGTGIDEGSVGPLPPAMRKKVKAQEAPKKKVRRQRARAR